MPLIDMYAKCGSIEKAREVFDKMHHRDVVSWNAMIGGYAMHGYGKEALKLFEKMKQSGMNPNHITLVSVLSACSHAGLVDEGYHYFNCMKNIITSHLQWNTMYAWLTFLAVLGILMKHKTYQQNANKTQMLLCGFVCLVLVEYITM
jgi:pentatricopeptide repeat protein